MEKISTRYQIFYWFLFAAVLFASYFVGKKLGADVIGLFKLHGF